jgi:hypothetical protein
MNSSPVMNSGVDFLLLYNYEKSKTPRKSNGVGENVAAPNDSMACNSALPGHYVSHFILAIIFIKPDLRQNVNRSFPRPIRPSIVR